MEVKKIQVNVTYEGVEGGSDNGSAPPIILHTYGFSDFYLIDLHRRGKYGWEECESTLDDVMAFMIVDAPPSLVSVTEDTRFLSMRPGETVAVCDWDLEWRVPVGDVQSGTRFRLVTRGTEVEWWDWGGSESHGDTKVWLPCFQGPVIEPPTPQTDSDRCPRTNNGGRPVLVVDASKSIEFTYVKKRRG